MKIVKIEMFKIDIPLKDGGYEMSMVKLDKMDSTVVAITTDTGITGYGEVCPLGSVYQPEFPEGHRTAISLMAPYLIGQNPLHIGTINDIMNNVLDGHNSSKSPIDIALWDIMGQAFNMPIYELLGGARLDKVPSYYAISLVSPDEAANVVKEQSKNGLTRWQLKLGGETIDEDIARIRKVNEVMSPGDKIYSDANRGWTPEQTIRLSNALRDIDFYIEQPCRTYEENKKVAPQLSHPLLLDENMTSISEVMRAISDGFAIGFGMKMSRMGGITQMRMVRDLCINSGFLLSTDDCWGGDIVHTATAHIGKTIPAKNFRGCWVSTDYHKVRYSDTYNGIENGCVPLTGKPGLGLNINRETLGEPVAVWG
ncbi:MAG: mandelate racemase/muconate lactonizing enzyme family protein [Alphaproteobacteria bacterium]